MLNNGKFFFDEWITYQLMDVVCQFRFKQIWLERMLIYSKANIDFIHQLSIWWRVHSVYQCYPGKNNKQIKNYVIFGHFAIFQVELHLQGHAKISELMSKLGLKTLIATYLKLIPFHKQNAFGMCNVHLHNRELLVPLK